MKLRGKILVHPVKGKWEVVCDASNRFRIETETRDEALRKGRMLARKLNTELVIMEETFLKPAAGWVQSLLSLFQLPKLLYMKRSFLVLLLMGSLAACGDNAATSDETHDKMENADKNYDHNSNKNNPDSVAKPDNPNADKVK